MFSLVLVDDEMFALEQYLKIIDFEYYGFQVKKSFVSSVSALEYIKNNHVDLIITDIDMPVVTGIDIAKYCANYKSGTIVVFISAYQQFDYAIEAINYKITKYLLKPVTPEKMKEVLVEAFNKLSLHSNEFQDLADSCLLAKQQIFSDIFCNNIKTVDDYKLQLKKFKLPDFLNYQFMLFSITINNLTEYLQTTWKHGINRLYQAINNITSSLSDDETELIMVRYSFNNIEVVTICLCELEDPINAMDAMKEKLCSEIKMLLNLDFNINQIKIYKDKRELIEDDNQNEVDYGVQESEIIRQTQNYIEDNYQKHITLDEIADYVSLNKTYFCTYYKKCTGETFFDTLTNFRVEIAKSMLKDKRVKSSSIYKIVGFSTASYFYKKFKEVTGLTPAQYQKQIFEGEIDEI